MGWETPLGDDIATVWQALLDGASGITFVPCPVKIRNERAAPVSSLANLGPRERFTEMVRRAVGRALLNAELRGSFGSGEVRTALVIGTSHGARLDDPISIAEPPDAWLRGIAADYDFLPIALSTACSSGADAILVGAALIRSGLFERVVCGGADVLTHAKRKAHSTLGTMATSELRSFDVNRDGTLLGEGAGIVVLEPECHLHPSSALGFVLGCGAANDAAGLTAPDRHGRGVKLAVRRALTDANLDAQDIDIVNGHGSGTPTNDVIEAAAYADIFQTKKPILFATKGAFGHSLGATGALEAISVIQALRDRKIPPIVGTSCRLPECTLPLPEAGCQIQGARFGLSTTIGFGGFNTAIVFGGTEA
ncbi:3-oxoacyl-ACP synthase [Gluconacetobacter sacchari DSM 12717]|nr:3-oxoacyl-ACP synthase [Gluconacetobacter sacchari DSM 12717]